MAQYYVDMDVTMSVQMRVEANSREEAEFVAETALLRDTMWHVQRGCYVNSTITDCFIDDDE